MKDSDINEFTVEIGHTLSSTGGEGVRREAICSQGNRCD